MLKENYYTEPTEIDRLVFDKVVPPAHYLRRVKQLIDFTRFRDLLKDCDSPEMGRTAEDPVRLLQLEFLPFHSHRSDREVMATAQVNSALRSFLNLALERRLPVPSWLSQFRTPVGVQRHQALCDQVVTQAREHGLVHERLRLKDATPMVAHMAVPSTLHLVAQTRQRLLESARPYGPERVAAEEAEAARLRDVTADLSESDRLAARVAHLRALVTWADGGQQPLEARPPQPATVRTRCEATLALAHRVLADRAQPDAGDQGRRVVDPEARCGKPGTYFAGSWLAGLVDAESALLTALPVLPGHGEEARAAPPLLGAAAQAQGHDVEALSMEGIGWHGAVLRPRGAPQGLGGEVSGPPPPLPESPYCQPAQCTLEARGEVLTCPGGQQTRAKERTPLQSGWKVTCGRRQCAGCALQTRGRATLSKYKGRSVIKNDYQAEYEAVRKRAQTARYAEVRQQHPRVERRLAAIVRYHGGRRCRYWGQWRVQVQYLLTGMVVNVKRMVKLLGPQPA